MLSIKKNTLFDEFLDLKDTPSDYSGAAEKFVVVNAEETDLEFADHVVIVGEIIFPATAVPSGDPNTLDDYEEGEFGTASANGILGAAVGTITCGTTFLCSYTKLGRKVSCTGRLAASAVNTQSGTLHIVLPFMVGVGSQYYSQGAVAMHGVAWTGDYCTIQGHQSALEGRIRATTHDDIIAYVDAAGVSVGDSIYFEITYFIS